MRRAVGFWIRIARIARSRIVWLAILSAFACDNPTIKVIVSRDLNAPPKR